MTHVNTICPVACLHTKSKIDLPAYLPGDFTFFNSPRHYELEKYKQAITYFINKIKNDSNVVAVYQIGGMSCPGISDIDLIIFVRPDAKINTKRYQIKTLQSQLQYLYYHDPFIVPENLAKHIHQLIPVFSLKRLYGKKLSFGKDSEANRLVTLIDLINLLYPKEFLMPYLKKKIDVRSMLCRLSAFRYIICLAQNVMHCKTNKNDEWAKFTEKIALLRSRWFKLNKPAAHKELISLLQAAIRISFQIIEETSDLINAKYAEDNNACNRHNKNKAFRRATMVILNGYSNLYLPKYDAKYASKKMAKYYLKTRLFTQVLPSTFLLHLLYLRNNKGIISAIIKNKTRKNKLKDAGCGIQIPDDNKMRTADKAVIAKDKNINDYFKFLQLQNAAYGYFVSYGFISGNLINKLATHLKLCLKTIYLKNAIMMLDAITNLRMVRTRKCLRK